MIYSNEVILINEPKTRDFFPEKFGNEIYLSTIGNTAPISYKSCFSIKYVIQGTECYVVNGVFEKLTEDDVLVVNDESEVICVPKTIGSVGLSIFIDPGVFTDVIANQMYDRETLLELGSNRDRVSYEFQTDIISSESNFRKVVRAFSSSVNTYQMDLSPEVFYRLAQSLLQAQSSSNRAIEKINALKRSTRIEIYKRVNHAKLYLEDNIDKKFNLAELSQVAALSPFHLLRSFKDAYQLTPHQFYKYKRIEKSKELLMKGLLVQEVSQHLGYADIYSFSKQFKQVSKVTPSYFRGHC